MPKTAGMPRFEVVVSELDDETLKIDWPLTDGKPPLARIPTDRGLLYRPVPGLTKLNNAYQEFTCKAEYAYDYGMPQWLARIDRRLKPLRPQAPPASSIARDPDSSAVSKHFRHISLIRAG